MDIKFTKKYCKFLLLLTIAIDTTGVGIATPLVAPLISGHGVDFFNIGNSFFKHNLLYGLSIAIYFLFMFIGSSLLGFVSDMFGRKKIIFICLCGSCLFSATAALSIYIHSITLFIISRAFSGIAAGNYSIAQSAIIDLSDPEQKYTSLGLVTATFCIGIVLGPLFGGILSDETICHFFSNSFAFIIASLVALINSIVFLIGFEDSKTYSPYKNKKIFPVMRELFSVVFTSNEIKKLCYIFFIFQLGWALYSQFMPLFLIKKFSSSNFIIGFSVTWIAFIFIISLSVFSKLLQKVISYKNIPLICLPIASCFIVLTYFSQLPTFFILNIPIAAGIAFSQVALTTYFSNTVSHNHQGSVMGLVGSLNSLAWTIGSLFSGICVTIMFFSPIIIVFCLFFATLTSYYTFTNNLQSFRTT